MLVCRAPAETPANVSMIHVLKHGCASLSCRKQKDGTDGAELCGDFVDELTESPK